MNTANSVTALKRLLPWLLLAGAAALMATLYQPTKDFVVGQLMPFGIDLPALDGKDAVDPRTSIHVSARGLGSRLANVELRDESGKVLAQAGGEIQSTLSVPLAFGSRYSVQATAERPWLQQRETRTLHFSTVAQPKLDGPLQRTVGADGTVTLHFDRPIGEMTAKTELALNVEADQNRQTVRLLARDYAQDKTYPVQLDWQTATGVPLPPLALELVTAPPLSVQANVKGLSNLGVALPLQLTFSEKLAERATVGRNIRIHTSEGKAVSGKWEWQGPQRIRFTPQPGWPASSTIEVAIEPQALHSERGGMLDKPLALRFTTGADRHLYVYLDAQRLDVMENGQLVRSFKVSTGKSKTPTVTGNFYIYDRYVHKTMRSDVPRGQRGFYEVEDVPYTQFFHKDYAFHGAFWHNSFGHPASHGCVNMATKDHNTRWPNAPEDAGWLYRWAALGVPVTVMATAPSNTPAPTTAAADEKPPAASKPPVSTGKAGSLNKTAPADAAAKLPLVKLSPELTKLPRARTSPATVH